MEFLRLGGWAAHSRRRARPQFRKRLMVELLEDRTLLSASPSAGVELLLGKPTPAPQYQWDMTKISAPTAWNTTLGSAKIIVADNDTGIDYTHPDLYKNVWINQGEIPANVRTAITGTPGWDTDSDGLITFWDLNNPINQGAGKISDLDGDGRITAADILKPVALGGWANGIDDDANTLTVGATVHAYVDDLVGWNFVSNTNNPLDDNGHGTHTAGTIGAMHNGIGTGVDGVDGYTQIMALKAFDQDGGGATFDIALARATEAIYYSARNGASVSNNSWGVFGFGDTPNGTGGPASHQALYNAIAATPNVLFVTSAGNSGVNNDTSSSASYPASYSLPNIISVAATASNDLKPAWSNYGSTTVDLGAPGASVLSTVPGGYAYYSGTSMASPHVAGAAALILAQKSTLSVAQVKDVILKNVDVLSSMSKTVSKGQLNVARALSAASLLTGSSTSTPSNFGASTTDTSSPTGKGKGNGLIQGQRETGSIDESVAAQSANHQRTMQNSSLNLSASDASHLSVGTIFLPPIPTPLPSQGNSYSQHWMAASTLANDDRESTSLPELMPDDNWSPWDEASNGNLTDALPNRQSGTPTHNMPPVLEAPASSFTGNVPINATSALEPIAFAPNTEIEPKVSGFNSEILGNAASKVFWLASAALFFAHGTFFSKSRVIVQEEERERKRRAKL